MIEENLAQLRENVGGYDYAVVLKAYWRGSEDQNDEMKTAALRWLRGEYSTKTEARQALGVRNIIDDESVAGAWKLLAAFVRLAGYGGLVVILDEMVNLYKLQSAQARNQNFEQILRVVNDVLQGHVVGARSFSLAARQSSCSTHVEVSIVTLRYKAVWPKMSSLKANSKTLPAQCCV